MEGMGRPAGAALQLQITKICGKRVVLQAAVVRANRKRLSWFLLVSLGPCVCGPFCRLVGPLQGRYLGTQG